LRRIGGFDRLKASVSQNIHGEGAHYRLVFDTAEHSPFFPRVSVDFTVGSERLHVPLLLNPFGYSTYRGS